MAAIRSSVWYVNYGNGSSTGYYAVPVWATAHAYTAGDMVRPLTAPAVGNERLYVCSVSGTSTTEPTWTFTKGVINAGTLESFQECTGQPGVNGDATNTPAWTVSNSFTLGQVITNVAGTGWFICKVSGTSAGSQPAGLATPVVNAVTTDNTATWTCIKTSAFTAWGAPHARLANSFTANWGAAGDTFYVGDNHAETQATTNILTSPGTSALPCSIYCMDRTASVPPVAANLLATATITTTGSATFIEPLGIAYYYGISFVFNGSNNGGVLAAFSNSVHNLRFDACTFKLSAGSAALITFGSIQNQVAPAGITLNNTTMSFSAVGQLVETAQCRFLWQNTASALAGAAVPTILFGGAGNNITGEVTLDGVDLSAMGTGKTIVGSQQTLSRFTLIDCKLGASVTVATTPGGAAHATTDLIVSDSSATGYRQERYRYQGTLTTSTSVYNNATDGVTPISWQVVTTANSNRAFPFECFQIVQWAAAATYAASLVQITSATASLLNSDVWVDVEYLGNASFPIASLVSSGTATVLTTGSSLAAGTWATGGLGNNYKLAIPSFTTSLAGYVRLNVKVAKASLTVNIDPAVTIA